MKINGSFCETTILDLPSDSPDPSKGYFWIFSISDFCPCTCVTVDDVEELYFEENGTDGWNINTVCAILVGEDDEPKLTTCKVDVNKWIDSDGQVNYIRYAFYKV